MIKELLEKRARAVSQSRELLNKLGTEKREFTAEERAQYDAWDKEIDSLTDRVEKEEKLQKRERDLKEFTPGGRMEQTEVPAKREESKGDEKRQAFQSYLRGGLNAMTGEEVRALQQGSNTAGGYLVPGEQMLQFILKKMDDLVFIRRLASKYQVSGAQSLGVPTLENDPADADWTTELGTGSEDSTMSFGKRNLKPSPFAKRIKISEALLQNAMMPVDQMVLERLAYKFGITEEKGFMTGNGSDKPLGLFTASADGISTGRDISTDNTTTAPTFDGLINCKYAVKGQYWQRASWVMHRDVVKVVRKIKNAVSGDYVWEPSVRVGEPDTILNSPVYMSEYAPNTLTTGLYVGIYGDFSFYWIADGINMTVKRLVELYAETAQIGFIGRKESDGMPVLEEAFARVKLA